MSLGHKIGRWFRPKTGNRSKDQGQKTDPLPPQERYATAEKDPEWYPATTRDKIYKPLDYARPQIRLFDFLHEDNERISCRLTTASLDDNPEFVALSYVCGDPSVTEDIVVDGEIVPVTTNLASALRDLSSHSPFKIEQEESPMRLWADAVCINQKDSHERSKQVQLMKDIYPSADRVIAWLAPEDGDIPLAFDTLGILNEIFDDRERRRSARTMHSLIWLKDYPCLYAGPEAGYRWGALMRLSELEYWKRVWTLQEVVLSRKIIFTCPSADIHSGVLERVGTYMSTIWDRHQEIYAPKPDFMTPTVWWFIKDTLQSLRLFSTARTARQSFRANNPSTNASLVNECMELRAGNPRDYVYGFLGLTRLDIVPDYEKEVPDVYCDLVTSMINNVSGFPKLNEVLRFAGVGVYDSKNDFPSWAPNFPAIGGNPYGRVNIAGSYTYAS